MDQDKFHQMVSRIKDLAIELGKTPTKIDLQNNGVSDHMIRGLGGLVPLIHAAGLIPTTRTRKVDNSIFEKDIVEHLEKFDTAPKEPFIKIDPLHTIILGDTHFPFVHKDSLKKAIDYIAFKKPKRILQIGDLFDMLSHGKFPRSMNVYTPKEEMSEGRKMAEQMWKEIQKACPKAEYRQILGNHDIRPMKRIIEQYPEAEIFFDFTKWFSFDGVQTHSDIRQELILEGIAYIHGYRGKLGDHMEYMRRPVVCGHSHRGGVFFKNYGDATLFELNAGYLGDPDSKALSYTAQKHNHWTHGLGEVDIHGPRFISL